MFEYHFSYLIVPNTDRKSVSLMYLSVTVYFYFLLYNILMLLNLIFNAHLHGIYSKVLRSLEFLKIKFFNYLTVHKLLIVLNYFLVL